MPVPLRIGLALFYVLATMTIVQQFVHSHDRSMYALTRWVLLYLGAIVYPAWWTLALGRKFRKLGVTLDDDFHFWLFMPAWFAAIAAVIALGLSCA